MFSLRKSRPLLAGAALLLSLAACGGGGDAQPAASGAASSGGGAAGGTIAIITVDPSNPYWKAEADTAKAAVEKLGYKSTVNANNNDPETQNQLIETAINDKVAGILLDPAGADESVAAVQKAVDAKIPVVLINAEISKAGLAKAQIVSNNAQGANLGAEAWAEAMDYKGTYVELFGKPSDNNAQVRSDGYKSVISQYPDLKLVGKEIANWDRQTGQEKMESLLSKNPDVKGVVAGNDEMALGAINALKEKGKLDQVKVLGFDGNQDAVDAVKKGEMVATVLQPIVEGTNKAITELDSAIKTGNTGVPDEKQALDCTLINKDNADQVNNFQLSS
ncbi:monosaccharide ABC transporter substrate-binding protein, CUT2 family [Microlunatus sagamiharensis]|uniref:Monosaccharide ABC transporter substrate-binding protein, CUT2 family n=1 Tax=Microlunatus sagamiharensis TaxID=546874 RepID=A0A1H2NFG5_9ACTN|nr:D-ribose ABC transporter substrate-binding protein [Microlunatus sagamiharensis]SDV04130.1 monosaccharide ABC transporter substrate-binding protein, CUT2 family [Microlunatus sagamiharensis]